MSCYAARSLWGRPHFLSDSFLIHRHAMPGLEKATGDRQTGGGEERVETWAINLESFKSWPLTTRRMNDRLPDGVRYVTAMAMSPFERRACPFISLYV